MTLRRKMAFRTMLLIVILLLLGGASLWGLNGLHQDLGAAVDGYKQLRSIYEVGSHVAAARAMLSSSPRNEPAAAAQIDAALAKFAMFARQSPADSGLNLDVAGRAQFLHATESALKQAADVLDRSRQDALADGDRLETDAALNRALNQTGNHAAQIRAAIEGRERAGVDRKRTTMIWLAVLSGLLVVAAIGIGLVQYRSVVRPLRRLNEGVNRVAAGQFADRVPTQGDDEFAALSGEFNRMAEQLDGFYHELEHKVAQKTRQLIRSERLASVGYLAAGVAHEINNPLGIMTGYAEMSLKKLRDEGGEAAADARKSLQVICEEAFRCKTIIQKLLTLAKGEDDKRSVISLRDIAADVVELVGGLGTYRERGLQLHVGPEDVNVVGSEGQLKQVVLNLTLNALEAVREGGQVDLRLGREGGFVRLSVIDNGQGMSPEARQRIFEPFYSGRGGTGLGLSICQAIVENHGGRISASSAGVGQGAEFTVELPAAAASPEGGVR